MFKNFRHKMSLIKNILFPPEVPPPSVRDIDLDEINNRNEKIRTLLEQNSEKEVKKCPNCGAEVPSLVTCVRCGKVICEECGTYCSGSSGEDIVSEKRGYYCDECW